MSVPSQLFPPCAIYTEDSLPDLYAKVFIVTGATTGIGLELAKMLYQKNGTVYIATRSSEKINRAVITIQGLFPQSRGRLEPLLLDLADLATIKPAVQNFLRKEGRLDVLFHNAGVMATPIDSKSAQGHELQMSTNAVAPFLLTRLLEPILLTTARQSPAGSVRIVWVASMMALGTPPGGIVWDEQTIRPVLLGDSFSNYMQSKAGVVFLAHEEARRLGQAGIISVSLHPGLMKTDLQRTLPAPVRGIMGVIFKGPKNGAYTEIFAAFASQITKECNGCYIIPWGRVGTLPDHISTEMTPRPDHQQSSSERFVDWCQAITADFV